MVEAVEFLHELRNELFLRCRWWRDVGDITSILRVQLLDGIRGARESPDEKRPLLGQDSLARLRVQSTLVLSSVTKIA